jgi:hypothetical protein
MTGSCRVHILDLRTPFKTCISGRARAYLNDRSFSCAYRHSLEMSVVCLDPYHAILVNACVVIDQTGVIYDVLDRTRPLDVHDPYPLTSAQSMEVQWEECSHVYSFSHVNYPNPVQVYLHFSNEIYMFLEVGTGPEKIARLQRFARKVLLKTRIRRLVFEARFRRLQRKTALACALHPRLGRESPLAILSAEELALVKRV